MRYPVFNMNRTITISLLTLALGLPARAALMDGIPTHLAIPAEAGIIAPVAAAPVATLAAVAAAPALTMPVAAYIPAAASAAEAPKLDWSFLDEDDGTSASPARTGRGPKPVSPVSARAQLDRASRAARKALSKVYIGSDPVFDRGPLRVKAVLAD